MYIEQTHSTNDLIREKGEGKGSFFSIRTDYQTAGRGQAGNGWESEKGQNLLCSTQMENLHLPVEEAFLLNMMVALAVYDTVKECVPDSEMLRIKWPNDIYYGDMKVAGILIENIWQGTEITRSIIGLGLNVHQTEWKSDAPNPISLRQITGKGFDIPMLHNRFLAELERVSHYTPNQVREHYLPLLYRGEGFFRWVERAVDVTPTQIACGGASGEFEAQIADVTRTGEIVLRTRGGEIKKYHFKQIRYVI